MESSSCPLKTLFFLLLCPILPVEIKVLAKQVQMEGRPQYKQTRTIGRDQELQDRYYNEIMFGEDRLFPIPQQEMKKHPHKHIGALHFKNKSHPGRIAKGTGLLISRNVVLTSAHNVYDRENQEYSYDFKFYLGPCGPMRTHIKVSFFYIPTQYGNFQKNTVFHDYALLFLREAVDIDDFLELSGDVKKVDNASTLAIFGYPGIQCRPLNATEEKYQTLQYGLSRVGKIGEIRETKGEIIHFISTLEGQSGAPIVMINKDNSIIVVGIHKGGIETKLKGRRVLANVGRLIDIELIMVLKREVQAMGAHMFKISKDCLLPLESPLKKMNEVTRSFSATSIPSPQHTQKVGRGLQHLQKSGAINSILQCLHKTKDLNILITDIVFSNPQMKAGIVVQYQHFIRELWSESELQPLNLSKLQPYLPAFNNLGVNDPVDILKHLLDALFLDLNVSKKERKKIVIDQKLTDQQFYNRQLEIDDSYRKSAVQDLFSLSKKVTYKCMACMRQKKEFKKCNMHLLSLPQDKGNTNTSINLLHQLLKAEEEQLYGFQSLHCSFCQKDTPTVKITQIYRASSVLIIAMKRFEKGQKKDIAVRVPFKIHPQDFIIDCKAPCYANKVYSLYGAVVQEGYIGSCHFISLCKDYIDKQWKLYDDEKVSCLSSDELYLEAAAVLFYQLVDDSP